MSPKNAARSLLSTRTSGNVLAHQHTGNSAKLNVYSETSGKPHSWASSHSCPGPGTSDSLRLPQRPSQTSVGVPDSFPTFYVDISSSLAGIKGFPSTAPKKALIDKGLFTDFLPLCPESCVFLIPHRNSGHTQLDKHTHICLAGAAALPQGFPEGREQKFFTDCHLEAWAQGLNH